MKIKLPEKKDKSEWRKWFAWFPVYVTKGDKRFLVWLEFIEKSTLYAAMYSVNQYRFNDQFNSKAYCECGHEVLQDHLSKVYDAGSHTNIICSNCGVQTSWDLDAPVPLFIKSLK